MSSSLAVPASASTSLSPVLVSYRTTTPAAHPLQPIPAQAGTCRLYAQPPEHLESLRVPDYTKLLARSPQPVRARPPEPPTPSRATRLWQGIKLATVGAGAAATGALAGRAGCWLAGGTGVAAVGLGATLGFATLVKLKDALFGLRHDGVALTDATLMRRLMPVLMRTRTESTVIHEQVLDLHKAVPFVEAWNAVHEHKITVFHLILASICRSADARPGLDRFVGGNRLYQRKDPSLSFVVKREFKDYASLRTVKFRAEPTESLESLIAGMQDAIHVERKHTGLRPVERETRFFVQLPSWLLSAGMYAQRFLDYYGLLPPVATRQDPLYTSVFAANLGSLGLDRVSHHLYEYGTAALFAAVGKVRHDWVVRDQPAVKPGLTERVATLGPVVSVFWTFDERVNDGHYCAKALNKMGELVENPEQMLLERDAQEVAAKLREDLQAHRAAGDQERVG